jgi:REP element-mobilizing transposase RayT
MFQDGAFGMISATLLRMPQSLSSVYLHAVFSTKNRHPYFHGELRPRVHAYIGGVTKKLGCESVAIGGVEDHVHLLVRFSKTITVADWLREVKRISSSFVKETHPSFSWQAGYGVFAVEHGSLDRVATYVRTQEEHHRQVSFQDELRTLMQEHGIVLDERFAWD